MICPECKQEVPTHKDNSLVMHANRAGGLCKGTNCQVFLSGKLTIGGQEFGCGTSWIDPDEDLRPPVDRLTVIRKIEKRYKKRKHAG